MRERLTVAFILLSISLCLLAFVVRSYSLEGVIRQDESEEIHQAATNIGAAVRSRLSLGEPVDRTFLAPLVADDWRLLLHLRADPTDIVINGAEFTGSDEPSRSTDIWAAAEVPGGFLMVSQSGDVLSKQILNDSWGIVGFFVLLAMASGLTGWALARSMSAPFRQLATAAAALGRGRFDLDLPRSRMPEVKAVANALELSATQLQSALGQEQVFAEHASHVIRTPLTSLRLELDDLALHGDLPDDVVAAIGRCVQRIDALDEVTGELVALSKNRRAAVAVPLRDLASSCAQRWADELAHHDRTLTAAVEGDLDTCYTPGPLEHIHELLLLDVLHRSRGSVRIVYQATAEGALKIRVSAADSARSRGKERAPGSTYSRARAVVSALGGRLEGDQFDDGLDLVLPRR
jgi:signal transduction histidine kinase